MIIFNLLSLLPLATAMYRDNIKTLKTLPAFTSSLVNLGKMDLSFYFMTKPQDIKQLQNVDHLAGFSPLKTNITVEETCPCMSKYSRNFPKNHPSELLNKILTSNDLFSFNKEPEASILCCESHENMRGDTIFLEFTPRKEGLVKDHQMQNNLPFLPFIFDNVVSNKPMLPLQPKAVEIFFFPKKKDLNMDFGKAKKELNKEAIQIVGDKELRNDIKNFKLMPFQPEQSSVKKDLTLKLKEETLTTKPQEIKMDKAVANLNVL